MSKSIYGRNLETVTLWCLRSAKSGTEKKKVTQEIFKPGILGTRGNSRTMEGGRKAKGIRESTRGRETKRAKGNIGKVSNGRRGKSVKGDP